MITDSAVYVNKSDRGVGTVFCMHDGHRTKPGNRLAYPQSKGREEVAVELANEYLFGWERINQWHFLEVKVPSAPTA